MRWSNVLLTAFALIFTVSGLSLQKTTPNSGVACFSSKIQCGNLVCRAPLHKRQLPGQCCPICHGMPGMAIDRHKAFQGKNIFLRKVHFAAPKNCASVKCFKPHCLPGQKPGYVDGRCCVSCMDVVEIKGDPMKVQMDAVANSLIPGFRVKKKFFKPKNPTVVLPPEGWTYKSTKAGVKNKKEYENMIHDELINSMPTREPLKMPTRKPLNNKMAKRKFTMKKKKKKLVDLEPNDEPKSGDFDLSKEKELKKKKKLADMEPDDEPKSGDFDLNEEKDPKEKKKLDEMEPDDEPKSGELSLGKILDYLPSR